MAEQLVSVDVVTFFHAAASFRRASARFLETLATVLQLLINRLQHHHQRHNRHNDQQNQHLRPPQTMQYLNTSRRGIRIPRQSRRVDDLISPASTRRRIVLSLSPVTAATSATDNTSFGGQPKLRKMKSSASRRFISDTPSRATRQDRELRSHPSTAQ